MEELILVDWRQCYCWKKIIKAVSDSGSVLPLWDFILAMVAKKH